jgi:hypothetical protein
VLFRKVVEEIEEGFSAAWNTRAGVHTQLWNDAPR